VRMTFELVTTAIKESPGRIPSALARYVSPCLFWRRRTSNLGTRLMLSAETRLNVPLNQSTFLPDLATPNSEKAIW
jgi:hypothetical protein